MRNHYSVPLLFFFLAASIGLFLRWQFILPTPGVHYAWVLHAHSHVMFLGWVTNVLFLSLTASHLPQRQRGIWLRFFWGLQLFVVAMMISFPLQGYGMYSIIFTTVHTLALMFFTYIFLRQTRNDSRTSTWFARVAWIFFFISTAGPFSLGYLMANGLGQTVWSNFAIYYYLHFQYNGFFLFGIFSLFFRLLEQKQIQVNTLRIKKFGALMAIACVPAYVLSILFARPGLTFNSIGAVAGVLQIAALWLLIGEIKSLRTELRTKFSGAVYNIFALVLLGLAAKVVIQLLSAHPYVAETAYTLRPVIIAYLHLVLLGVISLFLFGWYIASGLAKPSLATLSVVTLLIGYFASEVFLVLMPWWSSVFGSAVSSSAVIFVVSVFLLVGGLLFCVSFLLKNPPEQWPEQRN